MQPLPLMRPSRLFSQSTVIQRLFILTTHADTHTITGFNSCLPTLIFTLTTTNKPTQTMRICSFLGPSTTSLILEVGSLILDADERHSLLRARRPSLSSTWFSQIIDESSPADFDRRDDAFHITISDAGPFECATCRAARHLIFNSGLYSREGISA